MYNNIRYNFFCIINICINAIFCDIISIKERIEYIDKELQNKCQGTTKIGGICRKGGNGIANVFSQQ